MPAIANAAAPERDRAGDQPEVVGVLEQPARVALAPAVHVHRRLRQVRGPLGGRDDDRGAAVGDQAAVQQAERVGDPPRRRVVLRASCGVRICASGLSTAQSRCATATAPSCSVVVPYALHVPAGGQGVAAGWRTGEAGRRPSGRPSPTGRGACRTPRPRSCPPPAARRRTRRPPRWPSRPARPARPSAPWRRRSRRRPASPTAAPGRAGPGRAAAPCDTPRVTPPETSSPSTSDSASPASATASAHGVGGELLRRSRP